MKAFNLVFLALGGAAVLVFGASMLAEQLFERETAMLIVIPLALTVGMSARRVTEKILGYTLLQALQEGNDDTSN